MSYIVLARRWRPQTFDEVVGQRAVTQTLKNAIAGARIAHALLFAGPRGVGKTTTARIVAKALNCDHGPTPSPCNECGSCQEIAEGRSISCLEIDGASNRGIDEVRELRESIRYVPSGRKFRVIIIDEVHMLTEPAFNALLKTLEEPPPKVVFILATTDAHKIPPTVLSRCQRYDFRKLGEEELVARLREIAGHERVSIAENALQAIARAAEGSLRDAQSLLDQTIAYSGAEVSEADVGVMLGLPEGELLERAVQSIIDRDGAQVLALVESLSARGYDLQRFCQEVLSHLRDLMVAKVVKDPAPLLQASRVSPETVRSQARALTLHDLETVFQLLSRAEFEMRRAPHPRFTLEMALVEAAQGRSLQSLETLLQRLSALEERLLGARGPAGATVDSELPLFSAGALAPLEEKSAAPREGSPGQGSVPEPPLPSLSVGAPGTEEGWTRMTRWLDGKKRSLATLLRGATAVRLEHETLTVVLENGTSFARATLDDAENRQLVSAAAAAAFGRPLKLEYRFEAPPAATRNERLQAREEPPLRTSGARPDLETLKGHPLVQRTVELFGGQVVRVSDKRSV